MSEEKKRARIARRNKYRETVCAGCRYNYCNFPEGKSPNGYIAVGVDYSCWAINKIRRDKCPCYSR